MKIENMEEYLDYSKALVSVHNNDNFCMLRAILLAKERIDGDIRWSKLNKPNCTKINNQVDLIREKLNLPNDGLDVTHCQQIENLLNDYQIIIYHNNFKEDAILYYNLEKNCNINKRIYIYLFNSHYYVVTSPKVLFNSKYFCEPCLKPYNKRGDHKCSHICNACFLPDCVQIYFKKCQSCFVSTKNDECFKRHNELYCQKLEKCTKCFRFTSGKHVCYDEKF